MATVFTNTLGIRFRTVLSFARDYDPYGDSGVNIYRVTLSPNARGQDWRGALGNLYRLERCDHEHDCCGCLSAWARVRKVGPRTYVVKQHFCRNV